MVNEKIKESKEIIIDKIYNVLKSGKEISVETFIGISQIIAKFDEHEFDKEEIEKDSEVI